MLYSNRFARASNVKYIFSHAGGTIPYLADGFGIVDGNARHPGADKRRTRRGDLRGLYWVRRLRSGSCPEGAALGPSVCGKSCAAQTIRTFDVIWLLAAWLP